MNHITITKSDAAKLSEFADAITADPAADPVSFTRQARTAARLLPAPLAEQLEHFRLNGSESGVLLLRGLPLGSIPPTPPDNTHHIGAPTFAARLQAVINSALGDMIGYEAEAGGRLFQDMVPAESMAETQTSQGSRVILEAHTEQAFSSLKPDFLSLFCLRGHPEAATYFLSAGRLLQHLTAGEIQLLRQACWTFGVDESFRVGGHVFIDGDIRGPWPVLSGPADDPALLFDQDLQHGITAETHKLITRIIGLYDNHHQEHVLEPGDLLLIDNMRAIHGRSAFDTTFDDTARFVLRSFVVRDLNRSRHARAGQNRVINAQHS